MHVLSNKQTTKLTDQFK